MRKNRNTMKGRFSLCFTVILVCFVLTAAILYKTTDRVQARMSRLLSIHDQASGVRALVGDLVSSYRYYAISGNLDEQAILQQTMERLERDSGELLEDVFAIGYVRDVEDLGNMITTILDQTREALVHHNKENGKSAIEYYEQLSYTQELIDGFYEYAYLAIRQLSTDEQDRINEEKRSIYVVLFLSLVIVAGTIAAMLRWLDKMAGLSANMQLELERNQQKLEKADMEKLLRDSQIMALQARINPHFMFNTLNIVAQMAYVEGAEQTEQMIEAVSDYYRYNLKDIHYISCFRDEAKNIDDYIYIQKMRFRDRIRFETDYQETILTGRIPALVLQPLVENAIVHGLGTCMEHGVIRIRLIRDRNMDREQQSDLSYVRIEIQDNGAGIPDDKLEAVRAMFEGRETGRILQSDSIGLQNVIRRLKAFYGTEAEFYVDSASGKGTCFVFYVPFVENTE